MKAKRLFIFVLAIMQFSAYPSIYAQSIFGRQFIKKESKQAVKSAEKKTVKQVGKETVKASGKSAVKSTEKAISKNVIKKMTKEVADVFATAGYKEVKVAVKGQTKPLLVSPKFNPYMKVPREYTGDFNPVAFHKGNPRFVKDGCETNLGRMKRGLAPLYKDPSNTKVADHGYSAFELHHGGQKANPDYFALMAEEHKASSAILHPKRTGSEINRNEFSKKERAPLYKEMAKYIDLVF